MSAREDGHGGLTQREADILGRQFNSALANVVAYGSDHPLAHRTIEFFRDKVCEALDKIESVTLLLDRGMLFIENFQVETKFNPTRLVNLFRRFDLQSLTFREGLATSDIEAVLAVLADPDAEEDVEAIRASLAEAGVEAVKVNHVVMKRFTEGDEIISREGLEDLAGMAEQAVSERTGGAAGADGDVLSRVASVLSMRDLLDRPSEVASGMRRLLAEGMDADAARMQIRELGQRIRAEAADADDVSLADVMDALHRVRTELKDTVAGQEETERLLAESGGVISEVDEMTFETIVSIVRDEFRNGQASARRLAQIIRRILPDPREVRRLLPMLKKGLLEEGMSLADYANFVNELSDELQGDDLVQALETGAESTGVGVDEIVREIRRDPGEAARLVVLAAELRQAGRPDESLLSDALVDYIEKVGDRLGGERPAAGIRGTRETIGRIQEELVREVRERGIGDEVADRIRETFRAHFGEEPDEPSETSLYRARSSRLVKLLRESGTVEENDIVRSLERLFERETDLDTLGATMRRELAGRGFPAEKIQQIYDETIERLRSSKRIEMTPGEVLDPGPTEWFLTREITSCIRYGTHFSAILLMIARLREGDGSWRAVSTEEIEQLMSDVFELLPMHLRDLDLLGTLGSQERNVPLILLPMTDQPGAENVLERMLEGLAASRFTLDGPSVRLDPIGVAQRFDPDETPDRRAFVQALRGQLANRLVARLREDPGGAPA